MALSFPYFFLGCFYCPLLSSCTICGCVVLGAFLKLNVFLISWKTVEGRGYSVTPTCLFGGLGFLVDTLMVMSHFQTL